MRNDLALCVAGEIMIEYFDHFLRVQLSLPIEITQQLLLLGVNADHGLPPLQIVQFQFADTFELRVAIRILLERFLFLGLTQPEFVLPHEFTDQSSAHWNTRLCDALRNFTGTQIRPANPFILRTACRMLTQYIEKNAP